MNSSIFSTMKKKTQAAIMETDHSPNHKLQQPLNKTYLLYI